MATHANRRQFLRTATVGSLVGISDLGFLSQLPPVSAARRPLDPKVVRLQPEIEPLVRLLEETPARAAPGGGGGADAEGPALPRRAGGAAAGRRAERPAAAERRPQVPRGPGGQLGPPGQPRLARHRPLAADLLGARLLQELAGRRTSAKGSWTMAAGGRVGRARPPARPAQAFVEAMDGWDEAAADAAVAAWPARPGPTRSTSCSSATAPATSARSATRRSTSPTAGGRSSASAGSTPSRSCGRWPTPC